MWQHILKKVVWTGTTFDGTMKVKLSPHFKFKVELMEITMHKEAHQI